jgi:hypothetical protein
MYNVFGTKMKGEHFQNPDFSKNIIENVFLHTIVLKYDGFFFF